MKLSEAIRLGATMKPQAFMDSTAPPEEIPDPIPAPEEEPSKVA